MIKKSFWDDYHVMTKLHQSKDIAEALVWCKKNVQQVDPKAGNLYDERGWTFERFSNCTNFVFLREKDAFAFSLRFQ